jgi:hypothetical protein
MQIIVLERYLIQYSRLKMRSILGLVYTRTWAQWSPFVEGKEDAVFSRIRGAANFAEEPFGQAQHAGADVLGELGYDAGEEGDQVAGLDVYLGVNVMQRNVQPNYFRPNGVPRSFTCNQEAFLRVRFTTPLVP